MEYYKIVQAMPKVDLHRHLIGSVRPKTLLDIAHEYNISLPTYDLRELTSLITVRKPKSDLRAFLKPLRIIARCFYDEDAIAKITYGVIEDAFRDNVKYLELIIGSAFIALTHKLSLDEVYKGVIKGVRKAQEIFPVKVGLIDGPMFRWREHRAHSPEEVLQASIDYKDNGLIGFGLCSESKDGIPFSRWSSDLREEYIRLSKRARDAGLHITVHAGEASGAESIRDAIKYLNAERIGHGVKTSEDPKVLELIIQKNISLEICLTSNILSGVVPNIKKHPFKVLYDSGVKVTLNTDDPSLCRVTLTDEYLKIIEMFSLHLSDVKSIVFNGVSSAFLSIKEKEKLTQLFEKEFVNIQNN